MRTLAQCLIVIGCFVFAQAAFADPTQAQPTPSASPELEPAYLNTGNGEKIDLASYIDQGVQQLDVCFKPYTPDVTTGAGEPIKMLGAAFVYMGPGSGGASVLGHVAERFVYCRGQQAYDALYSYGPPEFDLNDPTERGDFESEYGVKVADFTPEQLKNLMTSLYVDLSYQPASTYALNQTGYDRTISEAWINADGATMYKMLLNNSDRYLDQKAKIQKGEPLAPYQLLKDNCMKPIKEDLDIVNPAYVAKHSIESLTPSFLYQEVKGKDISQIIVYPSQTLLKIFIEKLEGMNTAFEGFVPFSHALKGSFGNSWLLFYETRGGFWHNFALSPVIGIANLGVAAAETVYGAVTEPLNLIGKIPGLGVLNSKKRGVFRIKQGFSDMLSSFSETLWLKLRFPNSTPWTDEEKTFFQHMAQGSALLEYLKTKWDQAPIGIYGAIHGPAQSQ